MSKIARVRIILQSDLARTVSNHDLAELVGVDESMIRRWKHRLGIPQLPQSTGRSTGLTGDLPDFRPVEPETPVKELPRRKRKAS